jgi:hypothetical protein
MKRRLAFPIVFLIGLFWASLVKGGDTGFTIARLKYGGGGNWYWGYSAVPNMLKFLEENTNIKVDEKIVTVSPTDKDFFSYPFLFLTGHGYMRFTEEEVERLRIHLTSGGFLFANDSYGLINDFKREMKRVFPDKELVELPFTHGIYNCYWNFPNGLPKIHKHDGKPPQGFGIFHGERLVVFFVYESDIGDGWEDPQVYDDPPEKREAALKMGTNIIIWSLLN